MKFPDPVPFDAAKLLHEVSYQASRSGGKGGQNVNKVSTRVELRFDVVSSKALTGHQKEIVFEKLASRINDTGVLKIISQEARSQFLNKKSTNEKLISLLIRCLTPRKKRIPVPVPESVKEERLWNKKRTAEKKVLRKDSGFTGPID